MPGLMELANDVGDGLGRTPEYKELRRASEAVDGERELVELRNQLEAMENELNGLIRAGKEPEEELAQRYEETLGRLQGHSTFQRLVAAQANFDKILAKVNQAIAEAMRNAGESRIILPA